MEDITMAFNKSELILDRVRSITAHDYTDNTLLFRLAALEDPTLSTSAESEELTDSAGTPIATLYRAKKATFSASNALISLDLLAAQYGATRKNATDTSKLTDYTYEILTIKKEGTDEAPTYSVDKLKHAPTTNSIKYIYSIKGNQIGQSYAFGAAASATEFTVSTDGQITLPTGLTEGKIFVEYQYESENATSIVNKVNEFPKSCDLIIYAYFKDICDESKLYSGKIICHRAKLNPEQVELALNSTGKHPFEFQMVKDYCSEDDDELFTIVISE
jgi:hypothetical protein